MRQIRDNQRDWIGFSSPYGVLIGPLKGALRACPMNTDLAVVDDILVKPRRRDIKSGYCLRLFKTPYRNTSITSRADLRGSVFLPVEKNSAPWTIERWQAEVRKRLDRADSQVHVLDRVHRWIKSPRQAYQLSDGQQYFGRDSKRSPNKIRVIVHYRGRADLTCRLIRGLGRQIFETQKVELVLVNNQSSESDQRAIRVEAKRLPQPWEVIHIEYNSTFNHSAQSNLAVEASDACAFVFLNNDAIVKTENLVQSLADASLMEGVATVGPKIVGTRGLVSAGVQVQTRDDVSGGIGLCESECEIYSDAVRWTAGNSFACCAVSADVYREIKGMDADAFPAQYNDADFFLRAREKGYQHLYLGQLEVFHQPGQTECSERKHDVKQAYRKLLQRHDLTPYLNYDPQLLRLNKPSSVGGITGLLHRFLQTYAHSSDRLRGLA